jgi:PAS domain S-box-containing protein
MRRDMIALPVRIDGSRHSGRTWLRIRSRTVRMRLSRFIQQHMQPLLTQWDTFARSNAPIGHTMSHLALRNHAEQILLAIAADIETPQSEDERWQKSEGQSDHRGEGQTAAAIHGVLRQERDFSLLQLTAEYRALRATVLHQWLPLAAPLDDEAAREMVRFNEAIDQALAESVVAYDARAQAARRKSEAALRQSEERYRAILTTALDYAIFTTDADGIIDSWPPGAQAVFGWSADEAIGQHVRMTFTEEDRAEGIPEQEMRRAQDEGVAPNIRWHLREDGQRVFIEGATRPIVGRSEGCGGFLKVGRDATERRHWDERQQVLLHELQHRTRNIMAVVLTMFEKTRRGATDIDALSITYRERLSALARAQGLLSRLHEGDRVAFDTLVQTELSAMGALDSSGHGERVTLQGPSGVLLRSSSVQTLALALHELATNATKYGALAQEKGRLSIRWQARLVEGRRYLDIEWVESCVDMPCPERAPQGTGYGRELIERALPYQLEAQTRYEVGEDGIRCTIELPVSDATSPEIASNV